MGIGDKGPGLTVAMKWLKPVISLHRIDTENNQGKPEIQGGKDLSESTTRDFCHPEKALDRTSPMLWTVLTSLGQVPGAL
jgi:hypothetical protein